MALAITAALVGADTQPRPVQVNITGLTIGQTYVVTASSGTWSRIVQGGEGTATATQLVLIDVATPLNAALTYTVVHDSVTVDSSPVTVTYSAGDSLLQSLDGTVIAGFRWAPNDDPRAQEPRVAFYRPAGRSRPIMHYDVAGDESGTIVAETLGTDTDALREIVRQGAPVLMRITPGATVIDIDPVEVIGISAAPRVLRDLPTGPRQWSLEYTLVSDEDDTPLVMVTLADMNVYYATLMLSDINTQWSGSTLADMNAFDWIGAL